MAKIIKCGGANDSLVLKAEDDGDVLSMVFESPNGDRYDIDRISPRFLCLLY